MSKFEKYKNKYTNDNIIHSFENILAMPMTETLARSAELNSQYNQIGFPRNSELNASPNAVYVHAYTRSDGTQVRAHWRSSNGVGANQSYGGQTDSKPVPQYNPPSLDGYIDENGNIIQRNPDGSKTVIGQQGQLPDVPVKQNPDGTYDFDYEYEDIENPYPNDDSVFKKAPDYPSGEESTNPSDGFTKKIKDLLGKILTNSASSSFVPEPVVFEGVDNLNFQQVPIYSNNGVYSQVGTGNRISANQNNAVSGITPDLYKQTGSFSRPDFQSAAGNTLSGNIGQSRQRAVQTNPSFGNPQRVISNSSLPFGITFEDGVAQPVNLNLPSAQHSQSDWDMLSNGSSPEQIPTITPYKPTGIHPVDFAKSVDSGFSHGVMSLPMGIDKLVRNHIRAQMGLPPQSDETITEEYERAIGTPQGQGVGYNIGFFLGNIIPFVLANSAAVVMFPEISVLLINAMVLAGVISDSANEVGTSDKETLAKDIISRLAMNMALGFVGQKVSAFKETEIVFNKIYGLVNRIENQLTDLWRDIIRYLYLMSRSKVPVFVTAVNGQRVFNYGGFNYFVQLDKELKSYQTYKTGNSGSRGKGVKVYRKPEKIPFVYSRYAQRRIQLKQLKVYNRLKFIKVNPKEYKIYEDFDSALNFNNKIIDFFYGDYQNAIKSGYIKVYTLKPIEKGSFIYTSRVEAQKANGGISPYSTIIPIEDALFKNAYEGQYVPIMHKLKDISKYPLQYKRKYVNNKEVYELILPEQEKVTHEINTHMLDVVRNKKNIGEIVEYSNVEYTYTFINKYYGDYIFIKKEVNNATIR